MNVRTEITKVIHMTAVELAVLSQIMNNVSDHNLSDVELQVATDFKDAIRDDMQGM